jgi:deazaflavin-dependent oxidoreductase (nitroreductase family)
MRYLEPDFATKYIFNPMIMLATKLGLSMRGSNVLHVRGRTSGKMQQVPVNPLEFDGHRYLVAPRGTTQWVRNLRAAGSAELQLGRKRTPFTAEEIVDEVKPPILRAYLKHWKSETGKFFGGVDETASEETLRGIAPNHPVFRIT